MKNKITSPKNKAIIFLLSLALIANLALLIYSIVYANPESIYRKGAFVIGIMFIVLGGVLRSFYKSKLNKPSQ